MFSVVVPLFNKERYVRRCIESVLAQDFAAFEVVIIDDGSTDGSAAIASSFTDARISVIGQQNSGEGAARNVGIAAARYDWVALLDADDYWFSDHLSELQKIIESCPEAALISTRLVALKDGVEPKRPDRESNIEYINYFLRSLYDVGFVSSSTAAVNKRSVGKHISFGNYRWGADVRYWVEVAAEFKVAISDRVTAVYYTNTGGVIDEYASNNRRYSGTVGSLRDIAPSVEFAWTNASKVPGPVGVSMTTYASSLSWNFVRSSLYNGYYEAARQASRVLVRQKPAYAPLYIALSVPGLASIVVSFYKILRSRGSREK